MRRPATRLSGSQHHGAISRRPSHHHSRSGYKSPLFTGTQGAAVAAAALAVDRRDGSTSCSHYSARMLRVRGWLGLEGPCWLLCWTSWSAFLQTHLPQPQGYCPACSFHVHIKDLNSYDSSLCLLWETKPRLIYLDCPRVTGEEEDAGRVIYGAPELTADEE